MARFLNLIFLFSSSEDTELVDRKKRHHKKSKKVKKSKSKKREATSESESDSSNSSSSDSSSNRASRKQKKQKKSKRKNRRGDSSPKAVTADDSDVQASSIKGTQKVLYISSDEIDNDGKGTKNKLKRIDDLKKLRGPQMETGDRDFKSKWDSPSEEYDKKR